MSNIIDDLNYRGLIKDYSNEEEIRELLSTPQTIYCGFDPSASSMHIGNFVMIATLMSWTSNYCSSWWWNWNDW